MSLPLLATLSILLAGLVGIFVGATILVQLDVTPRLLFMSVVDTRAAFHPSASQGANLVNVERFGGAGHRIRPSAARGARNDPHHPSLHASASR